MKELRSSPSTLNANRVKKSAASDDMAKTRLTIVMVGFIVAFLVIGGRLGQLMLLSPEDESEFVNAGIKEEIARADIVDRNGVILATSLVTQSLYANPKNVISPEITAKQLAQVLPDLKYETVLSKLKSQQGFAWIKRNLTPQQQSAVYEMGLPGIGFQREEKRVYPHGSLFSHILGCTDVDNKGVSGIEKYFDEALISDKSPLELSIDMRVQHILKSEIKEKMEQFNAIGGAGLIMKVDTSEVVAMCSLPDYNPHEIAKTAPENMFNMVTSGVYEVGSSMKILTTALALESGAVKINSRFDISEPIRVGRFKIRDYHPKKIVADIPQIFLHSSNIGMIHMVKAVGVPAHQDYLKKFGLLQAPTLELPEVGAPIVPGEWKELNSMSMAYGYGICISPMQISNAVCSTINGGILRRPTLLKIKEGHKDPGIRVVSEKTSHTMRNLLRLVVQHGTGRNAKAMGYDIGGKTGTAEKVVNGKYSRDNIVTFISAFPMSDPKYLVMVMVDKPKGNKDSHGFATAGWIAAPIVKNVVARSASMLGVTPIEEEEATSPEYEIFKANALVEHH